MLYVTYNSALVINFSVTKSNMWKDLGIKTKKIVKFKDEK